MSDHSLLEIILYKPLHVATPHIIIMYDNETTRIQLLHIYIIYKHGPNIIFADTMSRLPNLKKT